MMEPGIDKCQACGCPISVDLSDESESRSYCPECRIKYRDELLEVENARLRKKLEEVSKAAGVERTRAEAAERDLATAEGLIAELADYLEQFDPNTSLLDKTEVFLTHKKKPGGDEEIIDRYLKFHF